MTTIRIDIRGRQFEAELPLGQVVRLGRQAGLELTLEAQGVAAVHCSLEALPDGRVRLRDLDSGEPTRRNGAVVRQAALSEGDVVELGEVRVTVGAPGVVEAAVVPAPPAVSRAAATRPAERTGERTGERTAERGVERSGERPVERSSSRTAQPRRSKVPWIVAGVAGVGLLALWMVFGRSPPPAARDPRIAEAQADAEAGRYQHAASLLEGVEADGRSDDLARQLADRVARGRTRIENAIAELTIVRLDKTDAMLAEHRRELLERFGEDAGPRFDKFLVEVRDARQAWLDQRAEVIARDADAWKREHRFDLWRAAWDTVGRSAPAGIDAEARVAEGQAEVEATANAYAERLVQQVEEKLENGLVWRAVDDIERVIAGYQGFAVHTTLEKLLERARIEKARPPVPGTPDPTTPVAPTPPEDTTPPDGPTTDEPTKPLPLDASGALAIARAAASEALGKRDFAAAAAVVAAAASSVPEGAPRDAVRAYAADLTRAHAGVSHLVDAIQADAKHFRNVAVGGRLRVDVRKADATGFDAVVQGGESRFTWSRLATSTWDTLLQRQDPEGEAAFDAACLARALGLDPRADALLVQAGASGFDEASLFRVIARWRGIDLPPDGFVAYDGRYVTLAEREALEREKAIVAALADVTSTKPETRQAAYARLLAFGEHAAPRLAEALRARRTAIVDSLASAPGWTSAKTKSRLFEELEKRRASALALIRDDQAYPYPNPDHRSQPEVEALVAAVREVWENPFALIVGWDDKLKEDLGQLAEVDDVLVKVDPAHDASLDAIAKRVNEAVDMPSVVPEAGAAKLRQYSLEVLAFNLKTPVTCTFEERDNVLVVNEYRMMMGLNAVKIHERLLRAARGHSRHMKENGYFAHDVPADKGANAENRSPGARAKAQGYGGGVGENIAMGLHTGRDAFKAWFTSSGHHRNMLGAGWTEMACGRSGGYWTQLFGAMTGKSLDVPEALPDPPPFYAPEPEAAPRSARRDDTDEGVE